MFRVCGFSSGYCISLNFQRIPAWSTTMLRQLLVLAGVDMKRIHALEAKGIRSMKRMLQISDLELAHIMDLSTTDLEVRR